MIGAIFWEAGSGVRKVLIFLLLFSAGAWAGVPLVTVEGGVSPDKRLAVAVTPQKGEMAEEAESVVYLIDYQTKKRIGPLEEVDASGGGSGTTTTNVRAYWRADGQYLIVYCRFGPRRGGAQLYRIDGRRAVPITLPEAETHPKGKILEVLTMSSNASETLAWGEKGELVKRSYGLRPKEGHFEDDFGKYGLPDFDDVLEIIYETDGKGIWRVKDVQTPKRDE